MTHKRNSVQTVFPDWNEQWFEKELEAFQTGKADDLEWQAMRMQFAYYFKKLVQDLEEQALLLGFDDSEQSE